VLLAHKLNLLEPGPEERQGLALFVYLYERLHGSDAHADGQSDLEVVEVLAPQIGDAFELLQVLLHRADAVVDGPGDLNRFLPLQPMAYRLATMGDAGADVLLLPPRGYHDAVLAQIADITTDGGSGGSVL